MLKEITSLAGNKYTFRDNNILGSGCSACVYKGFDWSNKRYIAIKMTNYVPLKHRRRGSTTGSNKEINLLGMLKNDGNILQIIDTIREKDYMYIITEYCDRGTLKELLDYSITGALDKEDALRYFYQIVKGVCILHSKEVMHRDLNMENIFLRGERCFIGDFGSATNNTKSDTPAGNPEYRAPEIFKVKDGKFYDKKVDIWSLGIVLHEMLYSKKPFKGDIEHMLKIIESKPYKAPDSANISQEIKRLIEMMLVIDPIKRIKIEDLYNSPLFQRHREDDNSKEQKRNKVASVLNQNIGQSPNVLSVRERNEYPRIYTISSLILVILSFLIGKFIL